MLATLLLAPATLRVLFVGNSYTFYNDLPVLVQRLSRATPGTRLVTDGVTFPGWTLQRHWLEGPAPDKIRGGRWDVVVLQEFSTRPITEEGQFAAYAQLFNHVIRASGAKPLLYMTWARRFAPQNQSILTNAYRRVGTAIGAPVAPAGEAWRRWLDLPDAPRLHIEDDSHPNFRGSFLNALVILGALRGQPLTTAPTEFKNIPGIGYPVDKKPFDGHIEEAELPRLLDVAKAALEAEPSLKPLLRAAERSSAASRTRSPQGRPRVA